MTGLPPIVPEPPPMGDEVARLWATYDELLRRCLALEEIAERLAVTSADPIATADFWAWKDGAENRSPGPGGGRYGGAELPPKTFPQ